MQTPEQQPTAEQELSEHDKYLFLERRQHRLMLHAHSRSIVLATCERSREVTHDHLVRTLEDIVANKDLMEILLCTDDKMATVHPPEYCPQIAKMLEETRMSLISRVLALYSMADKWTDRYAHEEGYSRPRRKHAEAALKFCTQPDIAELTLQVGRGT
jgi:hypothetical protein